MRSLAGFCDVLFYSSPCTGGYACQRPNRFEDTIRRIDARVVPRRRLWNKFEKVDRRGVQVGAMVFIEWP
eukprot:5486823-Lingulodinium_polyedra.AAC.1